MKTIAQLSLAAVEKIGAAAKNKAQENNWNVVIAICDAGGHLLWLQRLDNAPAMSATIAAEKAKGSAISGRPTKDMEDMVNQGRTAALSMPIVPLEGGLPIIVDGVVIGGIGVSGVKSVDDARIAAAGLEALNI